MITNQQQYQFTRERLEGFKKALVMLNTPDNQLKKKNPWLWQFNIEGLHSFIKDFTEQMTNYEDLINLAESEPITFEIHSLDDLPRALIKARIAAKISQSELAQRLGISLKQIQRYEDREYESATFTELLEVSQALGIQLQPSAKVEIII